MNAKASLFRAAGFLESNSGRSCPNIFCPNWCKLTFLILFGGVKCE